MTAKSDALIELGMVAVLAKEVGEQVASAVVAAGTTQGTATALTGTMNSVSAASSQTGVLLPALNAGRSVIVACTSSTTAVVYPPTGGTIQGGSANAGFNVAQNKTAIFYYIAPLTIVAILSA